MPAQIIFHTGSIVWENDLLGHRFEIWHALMERTGRKEDIAGYLRNPAPSPQPSPPMGERESERRARE